MTNQNSRSGDKFSKLTWLKDVPALKLNGAQTNVLLSVFNYTQADGTRAYASAARIAEDCRIDPRAVRRSLKHLVSIGALIKGTVGGRDGSGKSWGTVYHLGDISTGQICPLRVTNLSAQGDNLTTPTDPLSGPVTDSLDIRSNAETQSAVADYETKAQNEKAAQDIEETNPPSRSPLFSFQKTIEVCDAAAGPLPGGWHVNGSHVENARRFGVNAKAVGEVFKAWAHGEGERSSDWDRKFGYVIRALGENFLECPEDHGMAGLQDYSMYPDDVEWFEREAYRMQTWRGSNGCWFHARDKVGLTREQYEDALSEYVAGTDRSLPAMTLEAGFKKFLSARLIPA